MEKQPDAKYPHLAVNDLICGYRVVRIEKLSQINSVFYELEHTGSGARHVHISNTDTENTFGVAFKTVPADSSGVAHILEHTVLCGSEKYPVRDPFFSMLKRSLSTFMNAFTCFGLDHVSVFDPEPQGFLQSDGCLSGCSFFPAP